MKIRAFLVEDELLAQQTLRDFCSEFDWLEIVGEAADGLTALERLRAQKPALVFLDVQIPELGGIEVLRRLDYKPAIVFTTAFDDYAITAFEFEAVDYLQKPFGRERFRQTVERARRRLLENKVEIAEQIANETAISRLFVRDAQNRIVPLQTKQITRLEAADDYTIVVALGKRFLTNTAIGEFARRLPAEKFLRVHRSTIVNLDFVGQIEEFERRLLIYMNDGAIVQASRAGSQLLKKMIV